MKYFEPNVFANALTQRKVKAIRRQILTLRTKAKSNE